MIQLRHPQLPVKVKLHTLILVIWDQAFAIIIDTDSAHIFTSNKPVVLYAKKNTIKNNASERAYWPAQRLGFLR